MQSNSIRPSVCCHHCKNDFTPNRTGQKHCSYRCSLATAAKHIKKPPFEERFWSKVDKTSHPNGCWVWTANLSKGYGVILRDGKQIKAHRVSWEMVHGPIADGLWVLHKCDNPLCLNPDHLFLGTAKDNSQDAVEKGRNYKGERHHKAKLTAAQVIEIRNRGTETFASLGREFGVTRALIRQIVRRTIWRNL